MKQTTTPQSVRCAIYTRKSTEDGLDQDFNSLDAQREASEAYIRSQQHEGWRCLPATYDDGGFSGGTSERPALARLMSDIQAGRIDAVVVYKVDRLSRSLLDFAKMMDIFDQHGVSFVAVTQQFNTATSMGRLVLNVLLSFAQFEREIISERTRDKIAATRRKGKWSGGMPLLGYNIEASSKLVVTIMANVVSAGTDINVGSTITSLTVAAMGAGSVQAPALGKLSAGGQFDADITLWNAGNARTVLGSASIRGGISDAVWSIFGDVGTVAVKGLASNWQLDANNLKSGTFGGLDDVVMNLAQTLSKLQAGTFANTQVTANKVGAVALSGVTTANGGTKFGITAHQSVQSVSVKTPGFAFDKSKPSPQGIDDFEVQID